MNGHTGQGGWAAEAGRVDVLPLDWSDAQSWQAFSPPYEYILAADCVYSETAGELRGERATKHRILPAQ